MEIKRQMWLGVKCFCGKPGSLGKNNRWAVYRRNTRNYRQCHPSNNKKTIKFGMRIINGTYPFKFPLKAVKFQTWTWDFTHSWRLRNNNNDNNFYLATEWLASPGGTKFSKPTEEMSREELNVFRKSFCTSAGNRDGTLSVLQKFINEIHLRAAIDRFLRSLPLFSDPAFTEANKALEHLQKSSEKQATLAA